MRTRLIWGILAAAGIMTSSIRLAEASIVLSYTFNSDGEARLVSVESELTHAIQLSIQGGDGLLAVLVGDEVAADGSRLPVLRVRPVNADTADAAIVGEAFLAFSFQTGGASELGLRTLEFDVSNTGESGEFGCLVQSSLDGFGHGRPVLSVNPVAVERSGKLHYSVDLSGERFRDLGEVDFRVYFYSAESDKPLEFDGVQLNGEVIVAPEPGSSLVWFLMLAVILLVAAAAWTTRRNRGAWSYAMAGGSQSSEISRREPWSNEAREAILNIVHRGRIG